MRRLLSEADQIKRQAGEVSTSPLRVTRPSAIIASASRREATPARAKASLALAKVYLDQQQFDQAISVAGKSNSLARGQPGADCG